MRKGRPNSKCRVTTVNPPQNFDRKTGMIEDSGNLPVIRELDGERKERKGKERTESKKNTTATTRFCIALGSALCSSPLTVIKIISMSQRIAGGTGHIKYFTSRPLRLLLWATDFPAKSQSVMSQYLLRLEDKDVIICQETNAMISDDLKPQGDGGWFGPTCCIASLLRL